MSIEEVAIALREYGAAIRGDWGSIDGRSEQGTIDEFAHAFLNPVHRRMQGDNGLTTHRTAKEPVCAKRLNVTSAPSSR